MCGIIGIFNPKGLSHEYTDERLLMKMVMSMHNRGPDEKGILISPICLFGHSRLSIIDLKTGQQPMSSSDNKVSITFNGEIYNYIELKDELKEKGYNFFSTSDTEVLLYLYKQYGREMVHKLNGQFAFGIVDHEKKELFLARDRFGIRPLYFTLLGDTIIFSSMIKAIILHPKVNRDFNYKAYSQLTNLWTTFGEDTFFSGIYSLMPGEMMLCSISGIKRNIYWDISFQEPDEEYTLDYWKARVNEELVKSTALRLRADVPVNAYFSGGLDSSIVLQLVKKIHTGKFESYSVGFSDPDYDETRFQEIMNNFINVKNKSILLDPLKIGNNFEKVIFHSEQPVHSTAPSPLYYLSGLVRREGCKVVLTGEGADEIAWGYNIFKETILRIHLSKSSDDNKWLSMISNLYPYLNKFGKRYASILHDYYKQSLTNMSSPLFSHQIRMNTGKSIIHFLTPEVREIIAEYNLEDDVTPLLPEQFHSWSPLQRTQYLEMKTLLAGYLLSSQGDRMIMANSVEGRFPFLDHNVVELFSGMPDNIKLNGMNEKFILRETFKDIIPEEIINRNKQPYRAPGALSLIDHSISEKYFNEKVINDQGFFVWKLVERLRDKIKNNSENIRFNENYAFINIVATTIFKSIFEKNFIPENDLEDKTYFNRIEIRG